MRTLNRVGFALAFSLFFSLGALAAGGANVEATPQAKAYRASLRAIAAGDYDAYVKTLSSATRKQMEQQTKGRPPNDVMSFLKSVSPTDPRLTAVKLDGKKATLRVFGKIDGQAMTGSVEMEEEGGQWKVGSPSWEAAK
ncbi:MAG: hypothetical protein ABI592_04905 [Acidobacteriota bacterium]